MPNPKRREERVSLHMEAMQLDEDRSIEFTLPTALAVVLTGAAFSQLFSYAYATDVEVSLLGTIDREGSVFAVREFRGIEVKNDLALTFAAKMGVPLICGVEVTAEGW